MGALVLIGLLAAAIAADRLGLLDRVLESPTLKDLFAGSRYLLRGVLVGLKWSAIILLTCSGAGAVIGVPWLLYEVAKAERANWIAGGEL